MCNGTVCKCMQFTAFKSAIAAQEVSIFSVLQKQNSLKIYFLLLVKKRTHIRGCITLKKKNMHKECNCWLHAN